MNVSFEFTVTALPITAYSQFPAPTKTFSEEKSPHLLHKQVWQGLKLDFWIPEVSSLTSTVQREKCYHTAIHPKTKIKYPQK